jgi:hypothetical protein
MAANVERMGNMAMVSQLIEQAVKEAGGAFTKEHRVERTQGRCANPDHPAPEES